MKSLGCLLAFVVLGCVLLCAPALAAVSVGVRVADHERTLPQLSAVTVAQDTVLQTRLGAQLARHLAGATTGYQRLDELSMTLHERRLKLYDRLGIGPLRVELVWPDRPGRSTPWTATATAGPAMSRVKAATPTAISCRTRVLPSAPVRCRWSGRTSSRMSATARRGCGPHGRRASPCRSTPLLPPACSADGRAPR